MLRTTILSCCLLPVSLVWAEAGSELRLPLYPAGEAVDVPQGVRAHLQQGLRYCHVTLPGGYRLWLGCDPGAALPRYLEIDPSSR